MQILTSTIWSAHSPDLEFPSLLLSYSLDNRFFDQSTAFSQEWHEGSTPLLPSDYKVKVQ
jgi:hypothetical protein